MELVSQVVTCNSQKTGWPEPEPSLRIDKSVRTENYTYSIISVRKLSCMSMLLDKHRKVSSYENIFGFGCNRDKRTEFRRFLVSLLICVYVFNKYDHHWASMD